MNSYTVKILITLLSLFVFITIASQIYLATQQNYETETANSYVAKEKVAFTGVYLRDETPLLYSGSGVIQYPYPDGSKMAKDSVVAYVYNTENGITNNQQIAKLEEELNMLKKAQNPGTTQVAQPDNLSSLIRERYQAMVINSERGDYVKLDDERQEFLNLMNILQIVVGKEKDFNARINQIESEMVRLKSGQSTPSQSLKVTMPGYFVSYTDGFENRLSLDSSKSITPAQIREIITQSQQEDTINPNALGKIIDGYQWKMAGIFDNRRFMLTQGSKLTLTIPSTGVQVPVSVEDIRDTENPGESVLILACKELNFSLVQHRVEDAELIINEYSGIRVPRKAIRFLNGVKGVYAKVGQSVVFKRLNVIYEGDDYVVSKETKTSGDLLLYDDVIIEGISTAEKLQVQLPGGSSESETETSETTAEKLGVIVKETTSATEESSDE